MHTSNHVNDHVVMLDRGENVEIRVGCVVDGSNILERTSVLMAKSMVPLLLTSLTTYQAARPESSR